MYLTRNSFLWQFSCDIQSVGFKVDAFAAFEAELEPFFVMTKVVATLSFIGRKTYFDNFIPL